MALAMLPVHFALVIFGDEVLHTIYLGWPRTMVIPMSASQISRIIGVSPVSKRFLLVRVFHLFLVYSILCAKNNFMFK
jgi:hypothetical protein